MNTSKLPAQEVPVVRDDAAASSTAAVSPIQPDYPFPTSSPEFTQLLVRCFVEARNQAIDEYNALPQEVRDSFKQGH